LEAITVIEEMDGPFNPTDIVEGIKKIKTAQQNSSAERIVLLNDLINTLQNFSAS